MHPMVQRVLRTLSEIGIELAPESEIEITTATVTCPAHQAVPPGMPGSTGSGFISSFSWSEVA